MILELISGEATLPEGSLGTLLRIGLWFSVLILATGLLQNLLYTFQLFTAYRALRRRRVLSGNLSAWWNFAETTVPISILMPAYNEQAGIVESVRSMLSLHYPNFEVIVINDGSTDDTLTALQEAYGLEPVERAYPEAVPHAEIRGLYANPDYPRLLVVDKENGGKADSLNAGINLSRMPLFCSVDADSLLENDSLLRAVQPFMDDPDRVVAVGGTIRVVNDCRVRRGRILEMGLPRSWLARFQINEYLRAFLMARLAWSEWGAMMLISGAFGIFRRNVAIEVGGYSHGTVGEDMEIIVKIHRLQGEKDRDYAIRFVPDPVSWTEVPERLGTLARQRRRWQRGGLETFFKHRVMFMRPRYGISGTVGYTNMLISDVAGPLLELLGYFLIPLFYATGLLDLEFFLAYLGMVFAYGVFLSVGALVLEELELRRYPEPGDLARLTLSAALEHFGYRQINNFWRMLGWWDYLRRKQGWGEMRRKGFAESQD
ncbi:Glycosyltransferase, catalytic subunit of cellulose synthase and poly-beta-1,6-N-acetylglucosamine synthase [Thiohalospira halophila DSM 15071]|uniref:Glycosyltransferase, catalytic subunit of cellulose synthase and poly-beta-1,6-N-acetylglucosamine synthase n=1 Tax=Thiohalospira halophila DSM 15071 TaxID=1123397 RepID=A0A1I1VU96_9GAMM|nr:glycosyltransferase family 2 protein [Thiohalospira halophila]SFD86607.1 Glycosyltransferase, catalytic subunit of cellulose synthase and poly-beta-1,6-N-acetylglucosamine synthase [Thiohalospira halophila DSM 15071]